MLRALRQVPDAVEHEGGRFLPDVLVVLPTGARVQVRVRRRRRSPADPGGPADRARTSTCASMAGEDVKAPWHFKLLMVLLAIYLGWRLVEPGFELVV